MFKKEWITNIEGNVHIRPDTVIKISIEKDSKDPQYNIVTIKTTMNETFEVYRRCNITNKDSEDIVNYAQELENRVVDYIYKEF